MNLKLLRKATVSLGIKVIFWFSCHSPLVFVVEFIQTDGNILERKAREQSSGLGSVIVSGRLVLTV